MSIPVVDIETVTQAEPRVATGHSQRVALGVHYDGSDYHGFQTQETGKTIQMQLERAVSFVANHPVSVSCAGRTDAGVHATGQVIHFDTTAHRRADSWIFGTNSNLPGDIAIQWAAFVPPDFHARYSARARRYRYLIYNHSVRPAMLRYNVGFEYRPLDEQRMQRAAACLVGEHDFSSFRGAGCQAKHAVRTVQFVEVRRVGHMVVIEIQANAFLLHMVRNLAGALVAIGRGEKPETWIESLLKVCDRTQAGVTAPPNGLYLVDVVYPEAFHLPRMPLGPFFLL